MDKPNKESHDQDENLQADDPKEDLEEIEDKEESADEEIEESETVKEDEPLEEDLKEKDWEDELESDTDKDESSDIKFRGFNPNEEERSQIFYEPPKRGKNMKKFIIWLIILAVLALVVGFFATATFRGGTPEKTTTQASPVPVSVTPTPTPTPQIVRSEWSFEVLNGSGITGQAKKIADKIKELGYTVTKTGNADKQTYEETQIFVTDSLKEKVDLVIADLKDAIRIATVAGELKGSTPSARIIIGKDSE